MYDDDWPYDPAYRDTYYEVVRRPPGVPTTFRQLSVEMIDKVWSRPLLSMRERRLGVLAILAMTSAPRELAVHLTAALDSGDLSPEEIDEVSIQIAMYGGWPRGAGMQAIAADVKRDLGLA
jgi:4-carboxymuconolactone decarboxylase